MRILSVIFIVTAVLGAPAAAQDFQKGREALLRGDYRAALQELRPLAEQGHAGSQNAIGVMHAEGRGLPQGYAEAVRWYRLAADQGHPLAQFNLGSLYHNGVGVRRDFSEALRWFQLSAEQGYAQAQNSLGWMYTIGQGVTRDHAEAVWWYSLAAEQGEPLAQYNLGLSYVGYHGAPQDYALAYKWLTIAASRLPPSDVNRRARANQERHAASTRLTPEQLAEAHRLANEWKPKSEMAEAMAEAQVQDRQVPRTPHTLERPDPFAPKYDELDGSEYNDVILKTFSDYVESRPGNREKLCDGRIARNAAERQMSALRAEDGVRSTQVMLILMRFCTMQEMNIR